MEMAEGPAKVTKSAVKAQMAKKEKKKMKVSLTTVPELNLKTKFTYTNLHITINNSLL